MHSSFQNPCILSWRNKPSAPIPSGHSSASCCPSARNGTEFLSHNSKYPQVFACFLSLFLPQTSLLGMDAVTAPLIVGRKGWAENKSEGRKGSGNFRPQRTARMKGIPASSWYNSVKIVADSRDILGSGTPSSEPCLSCMKNTLKNLSFHLGENSGRKHPLHRASGA